MTARSWNNARHLAGSLLGAWAFLASPPAANAQSASANAAVVIVEPVGAGLSFDIISDAVSAVFLNAGAGDSVSLTISGREPETGGALRNNGGVLVMASGVYRIDLLEPTTTNARLLRAWRAQAPDGNSILFLAQFN